MCAGKRVLLGQFVAEAHAGIEHAEPHDHVAVPDLTGRAKETASSLWLSRTRRRSPHGCSQVSSFDAAVDALIFEIFLKPMVIAEQHAEARGIHHHSRHCS